MARYRRSRKTRNRSRARRTTRRARGKQSRLGLRMGRSGFRKSRRKGRIGAKWSTVKKYRRLAKNPKKGVRPTFAKAAAWYRGAADAYPHNAGLRRAFRTAASTLQRKSGTSWRRIRDDYSDELSMAEAHPYDFRTEAKHYRRALRMKNPAQFPMPFASALNPGRSGADGMVLGEMRKPKSAASHGAIADVEIALSEGMLSSGVAAKARAWLKGGKKSRRGKSARQSSKSRKSRRGRSSKRSARKSWVRKSKKAEKWARKKARWYQGRHRAKSRRGGNSKRALNRALYHARGGRYARNCGGRY